MAHEEVRGRFAIYRAIASTAGVLVVSACSVVNAPDEAVEPSEGGSSSIGGAGGTGGDVADVCGDGSIAADEGCDDGNTASMDGCDTSCSVETGWECSGEPSDCTATCGDGMVLGAEGCDDGNTDPMDGCDGACMVEAGWSCMGEPSGCTTTCGDGIVAGMEECDDMNTMADDGCSDTCGIELGYDCTTPMDGPSECEQLYPMITEFSVGNPDYAILGNPHMVPILLDDVHMMWNHTSDTDTFPLPTGTELMPGEELTISEQTNNPPPGAFQPPNLGHNATYFDGGWVSLCDGPCSETNGQNVLDLMAYEGDGPGPALPSGVTFNGGPATGVDISSLQTYTVYRRIDTTGSFPSFQNADWAWRCSSHETCFVADSLDSKTGGLMAWTDGGMASYTKKGTDSVAAHGDQSMHLIGSSGDLTGTGFNLPIPAGTQPTAFQAWIRPGSTAAADAYVVLSGAASGDSITDSIVWVYAPGSGNLVHIASPTVDLGTYSANTWYLIEVSGIDWVNKTFSIRAQELSGGTLTPLTSFQSANFRKASATEARRIMVYNFNDASTRWDKFMLR